MKFGCKDCENRCEGCHVVCEQYNREKASHEALKKEIAKKKAIENLMINIEVVRNHRRRKTLGGY